MTETERQFCQRAVLAGWKYENKGWPDFWCLTPHGLCFVEVKGCSGEALRPEQDALHAALAAHGIPCYRWDPEAGLTHLSGPALSGVAKEALWFGDPSVARKGPQALPREAFRAFGAPKDATQASSLLRDMTETARREELARKHGTDRRRQRAQRRAKARRKAALSH